MILACINYFNRTAKMMFFLFLPSKFVSWHCSTRTELPLMNWGWTRTTEFKNVSFWWPLTSSPGLFLYDFADSIVVTVDVSFLWQFSGRHQKSPRGRSLYSNLDKVAFGLVAGIYVPLTLVASSLGTLEISTWKPFQGLVCSPRMHLSPKLCPTRHSSLILSFLLTIL